MNERPNPFADLVDAAVFMPKAKPEKPVAPEALAEIAEQNNFTSRQPMKAAKNAKISTRKPRRHRTGRNVQFNAKATEETIATIYRQADELGIVLGEWMRLATEAMDREKASHPPKA